MTNPKTPLAVGDRVRIYESTGLFDGVIVEIMKDRRPQIRVSHSDGIKGFERLVFSEQCRKLKPRAPKPKKISVSLADMERAWDEARESFPYVDVASNGAFYKSFCRALGMESK